MNLKEMNEGYEEYLLSEEYLVEGLKIFKESKKLYKFAAKITKRVTKLQNKNKDMEAVNAAKKLADDITKLADQYKVVEDAFANKELDKRTATNKLKDLKTQNEVLMKYIKSEKTKSLLGKIGLGSLVLALGGFLGSIFVSPELIASVGAHISSGVGTIADFLAKAGSAVTSGISKVGSALLGRGAQIQTLRRPGDLEIM